MRLQRHTEDGGPEACRSVKRKPILTLDENGKSAFTGSRPANHGSGFIVKEIIKKREDTEPAPPAGRGEAPRP
jgi:hypothetical protein